MASRLGVRLRTIASSPRTASTAARVAASRVTGGGTSRRVASAATVGAGLAVAAGVAFGIYRMGQARSKASQQMMARAGGRSSAGFDLSMSEEQLQNALKDLTPFQKSVTMEGATERAFTGETINGYKHDNKEDGVYVSAVGGLPLFDSRTKL